MNAPIDLAALKGRQQMAWASGDYAVIGTTLQIVGESLAEACDLRLGRATCSTSPPATATRRSPRRAAAAASPRPTTCRRCSTAAPSGRAPIACDVKFEVADAEALPFEDASFDAVLSTFGVMFAPDQATAAAEMARVCRPGGRIGLANWTPDGFIGQLFKTLGRHLPPPAGVQPPSLWGIEAHLHDAVRRQGGRDRRDAADVQLPLPLGRALHRGLPHVVRPGAQGLRRAAGGQGHGAGARPDRSADQHELAAARARSSCPSEYLEIVVTRR